MVLAVAISTRGMRSNRWPRFQGTPAIARELLYNRANQVRTPMQLEASSFPLTAMDANSDQLL